MIWCELRDWVFTILFKMPKHLIRSYQRCKVEKWMKLFFVKEFILISFFKRTFFERLSVTSSFFDIYTSNNQNIHLNSHHIWMTSKITWISCLDRFSNSIPDSIKTFILFQTSWSEKSTFSKIPGISNHIYNKTNSTSLSDPLVKYNPTISFLYSLILLCYLTCLFFFVLSEQSKNICPHWHILTTYIMYYIFLLLYLWFYFHFTSSHILQIYSTLKTNKNVLEFFTTPQTHLVFPLFPQLISHLTIHLYNYTITI